MKNEITKPLPPVPTVDEKLAEIVPTENVAAKIIANMVSRFDVGVETASGMPLMTFQGIPAKTKAQAIHKASQMLVFTADRSK